MGENPPFRLILASGSPARRVLLKAAGFSFDVMPANIDEPTGERFSDPRTLVQHIAYLKAAAVAPKIDVKKGDLPAVVLAADTIGWLNGRAIGKPADEADARRIIRMLAGTQHELWTGVCLWRRPDDLQISWQEMSKVEMSPMSEKDLDDYLKTRQWEGCSGAYAILEKDDPHVRVIEGSITNVIGLPMESLLAVFKSSCLADRSGV